MLIDSHCHIDDPRFDADREAMIQRARDAGVGHFVTIGCDLETSRAAVALAHKYPFISATVGIHPHEVKHIQDNWYDELRALARSKRSEEHTSELQSQSNLVCRLLLEKKKKNLVSPISTHTYIHRQLNI